MGGMFPICIDLLNFNGTTLLNSVATTPKNTYRNRVIVRRFWVSSTQNSLRPSIGEMWVDLARSRGDNVWPPRALAIWNFERLEHCSPVVARCRKLFGSTDFHLGPPTQLAETHALLVLGRRTPSASIQYAGRLAAGRNVRVGTFMRSRRTELVGTLCWQHLQAAGICRVGDAVPFKYLPGVCDGTDTRQGEEMTADPSSVPPHRQCEFPLRRRNNQWCDKRSWRFDDDPHDDGYEVKDYGYTTPIRIDVRDRCPDADARSWPTITVPPSPQKTRVHQASGSTERVLRRATQHH